MIHKLIYLIVFLIPLSLVRFELVWLPFNAVEALIYFLFLLWLLRKIFYSRENGLDKLRRIKKDKTLFYPAFLILLGVTLSVWFSDEIQLSAGIWKEWFVVPTVFAFLTFDSLKAKEQFIKVLASLFASGVSVAVISLFYLAFGELTYDGRLEAFYSSPNYLAMYLVPALIFGLFLLFHVNKTFYKILLILGLLFILPALFFTCSYGAWLGLFGAALALSILNFKKLFKFVFKNRNKAIFLFLLIILVLGFVVYDQASSQKFENLIRSPRSSLDSRVMIWRSGFEIIKDYPVFGIGPGLFQDYYLAYQDKFKTPYLEWAVPHPHNILMAFYLEAGIIGFLGFVSVVFLFFKKNLRSGVLISSFLFAFMVYFLIHGMIDVPYRKADLALLFWLVIILNYKAIYLFDR